MPRTKKIDPVVMDRIRVARAGEDTALAAVTYAQAGVGAAAAKRASVLATLDSEVAAAEADLAAAYAELVGAAGLDRAAHALGLRTAALRKRLPTERQTNGPSAAPSSAPFNPAPGAGAGR